MSLYLDASVLVALFIDEANTQRAQDGLSGQPLIVGDFAAAEFASAVSRRVRTGDITASDAAAVFSAFDTWVAATTTADALDPEDGPAAAGLVRRLDLGLRAPDALHIAIARRLGAVLFTLDGRMATAAEALGVAVKP